MSEIRTHRTLVHLAVEDAVAILTLDNPPLNVVTLELTTQLARRLDTVAADRGVRAVVITGAGTRAFCAGSDVTEFGDMMEPGQVVEKKLRRQNEVFRFLSNLPKPTIAALNGLAFGGGLEIACCCDLLIAEQQVELALPEIKLGVFPSSGGTFRATRRIGVTRAKQMMFLGGPINAPTALAWGLVNSVVPTGSALNAAHRMAAVVAQRPAYALQLCKGLIDAADDLPEQQLIQMSLAASDKAFSSPECHEGVRAFLAKETPNFSTTKEYV